MTKIILLDSNSLINRAFYALPPMTTSDGETYTNAVYGYLSMLAKLIAEHKPTHIGAVFDMKAPTFRHKMYDGYKGTRKPMPPELAMQVPILKELLQKAGIKIIQMEGYEADDIIGTLAKRFDVPTCIISGDRDVLQLVDDNTVVFHTKRGVTDIKIYDIEALKEEELTPQKIIEYKALAGDSSDNIPGAPGVGQKTAMTLLSTYGDVDGIYEHIQEIKGKLYEKLTENKDLVYLSKELATINVNTPVDCTLDDLSFSQNYSPDFYQKLKELEIKSLISRFGANANSTAPTEPEQEEKKAIAVERIKITDANALKEALGKVKDVLYFDFSENIVFSLDNKTEYYIQPILSFFDEGISIDEAIACFGDIFTNEHIRKVVFDLKSLMHKLKEYGLSIQKPYDDEQLLSYVIDPNHTPKTIKELSAIYVDDENISALGLYYADIKQQEKAQKTGVLELYNKIELPLVTVLFDMENEGFCVDRTILEELSDKYTAEIQRLQDKIYSIAGEIFNINSSQQLSHILFEKLDLPHSRMTKGKTGYSVSSDVLEELEHPIVTEILRYKQLSKLQSTYINGMRGLIDPKTSKVHTLFKQCVTATGRLSSNEPNLQNIPVRTEEGRNIRKMFVPTNGNILVSADYSQIELRLLAHFCQDEELQKAYLSGGDIHALTASKIFEVPLENVTKEMRRNAKAVNFGIIYGISAFGLARNTGLTVREAKAFVDKYFKTYPSVKAFMDNNVKFAKEKGYIVTLEGRRRYFPELVSPNHNIRAFGERAAMNMPMQGSASDIIKIAMLKVYNALKDGGYKAKLILQVHDELVVDCPIAEAQQVEKLLVKEMNEAYKLKVPLVAEPGTGYNWYEIK